MIHCYTLGGLNVVLDVNSGAVHVVDDVAMDIISMFKERPVEEIKSEILEKYSDRPDVTDGDIDECLEDVARLEREGKLFSEDAYENLTLNLKKRRHEIKALCLHVAHTCNLCCSYCFAGQGRYHGERALMSFETGKRALDFLVENSGSRKNLEVDFFGGEPLMNFDVVKRLTSYARSIEEDAGKHFRFTLTTNGVLVDDDVIDFSNREMNNVVMSIDGRREVHDRFRVHPDGRGSYDEIIPKFQRFAAARGERDYYIRGTFTHYNPDFLNDIKAMADLGFTRLSMEPVVCAPDDPCALTQDDLPVVLRQYEELGEYMLEHKRNGKGIIFYHYMIDLGHGPCIYKRISGCGSGTEYLAVTPEGDLYPCHQFVGEKKFLMGNIWDGVTNTQMRDDFAECNVYSRPECRNCWARLFCAGGCAANAYHASGSIRGTYEYGCELFKKRIECAIVLKIKESEL